MINDLTAGLADANKHEGGNSSAGTRLRKTLQGIKTSATTARKQIQDEKNAETNN
ncbi:MAG TPA: histone H1 [Phycisphaerales bacterium]|nr:histone H1 [Phycisphaerales bacterium]